MKRIILTGASSWLWASLASVFHEAGYEVVGLCRSKPADFVKWIPTDLADMDSLEKSADAICQKFSRFEILINCAGILQIAPIDSIEKETAENLLKINVLAPIILTSKLMEKIKENQSDIVNVGSTVWFKAYESQAAYGTSKWAIRWFNENLQLELKKTKTRVIGFNPGWFQSPIFEKATWVKTDLSPYMNPDDLAKLLFHIVQLPKNMEVSEIIINRK